jgi:phosphatidylinositol 4-kinase A
MCSQAAVVVLVQSVSTMDGDSKSSKDMLQQTLAWFIEATKSCILSSWRKLKICEELFCTLLNGISQITVSRGGQLLPVLLIPLKPLVVSTCSQACFFCVFLVMDLQGSVSVAVWSYGKLVAFM